MELPLQMQAMVMEQQGKPLINKQVPLPEFSDDQVLVRVIACGICRTDLHILDGELKYPKLPLIPGHEIIGEIVDIGINARQLKKGDMIGIPWLAYTCGKCKYCLKSKENLCQNALFTGYTINGGYAQYTVAYERYCFPISVNSANASAAPFLCAGLIGYRSYKLAGDNIVNLGIYGFGAAAHILIQVAKHQNKKIFAFTREGDETTQQFALQLGAKWAGGSSQAPPEKLDAAIIFAPAGELLPIALKHTDKGGTVVCGGIHMSDIPSFPYELLWEERVVRSVANLTHNDGLEFLKLASEITIHTNIQTFPLQQANEAIDDVRKGKVKGAAVLVMP